METYLPKGLFSSEREETRGSPFVTDLYRSTQDSGLNLQLTSFPTQEAAACSLDYNQTRHLEHLTNLQQRGAQGSLSLLEEQLYQQMSRDRILKFQGDNQCDIRGLGTQNPASSMTKASKHNGLPSFWRGASPAFLMQQLQGRFTTNFASFRQASGMLSCTSNPHEFESSASQAGQHFMGPEPGGLTDPSLLDKSMQQTVIVKSEEILTKGGSRKTEGFDPDSSLELPAVLSYNDQLHALSQNSSRSDVISTKLESSFPAKHCNYMQAVTPFESNPQLQNLLDVQVKRPSASNFPEGEVVQPQPGLSKSGAGLLNRTCAKEKHFLTGPDYSGDMRPSIGYFSRHSWSTTNGATPGQSQPDGQEGEVGCIWEDSLGDEGDNMENLPGERVRKKAKVVTFMDGRALSLDAPHSLPEYNDNKKLHEKFQTLKGLLQPDSCSSEVGRESVLGETIYYLKEMRRWLQQNDSDTAFTCSNAEHPSKFLEDERLDSADEVVSSDQGFTAHQLDLDGTPLLKLEDIGFDTAGLDQVCPDVMVDDVPQIEVRMMEKQQVMVKLSAKDRPGLFTDLMLVMCDLKLHVQHANIRTTAGKRNDVFAAKMDLSLLENQTTQDIAAAISNAIEGAICNPGSNSSHPLTPDVTNLSSCPRTRTIE